MIFTGDKNKIIIYGAGYCGILFAELLRNAQIEPECYFDKNEAKQGSLIEGIPVCAPSYKGDDYVIVVCILKKGELFRGIKAYLEELGYSKIVHIYDYKASVIRSDNLIITPDKSVICGLSDKFQILKTQLADERSQNTLQSVWAFLSGNTDAEFEADDIKEQYFAYDLYRQIDDEVVVDCGGFKGEVMKIFFEKNQGKFEHYTIIEPDDAYLSYIEQNKSGYDSRITVYNYALSDKCESLRLTNYGNDDSVIKPDGEKEVDARTLDLLMGEDARCTLLKIDVEGYERKVLQGAKNLIVHQKPVIAIAAYHHESDFYDLYALLKEYYQDYRFYLRSYMNIQETILYAIPPNRVVHKEILQNVNEG